MERLPAVTDRCALHPDGTLLEVGFPGDGIEGSESDDVRIGLWKVEGHEDLPRGNDSGNPQLDVGDGSAPTADSDTVVRLQIKTAGVHWIHLEPGIRDHVVEKLNLRGFGTSVPVLYCAAGIENQIELGIWLLREWITRDGVQSGAAVFRWEETVCVE